MDVTVKRLALNLVESPKMRQRHDRIKGRRIGWRPSVGARPRKTIVHNDTDVTLPLSDAPTHAVI